MPVETIPFKVLKNGDFHGEDPAYYERVGGQWKPTSWRQYAAEVGSAAKAMIGLGIEPGHVVTIEPGIYIIDQLLENARNQAFAGDINWSEVARLRPFGGVRIEDDVVCTDSAPENLTRDAFAAL